MDNWLVWVILGAVLGGVSASLLFYFYVFRPREPDMSEIKDVEWERE